MEERLRQLEGKSSGAANGAAKSKAKPEKYAGGKDEGDYNDAADSTLEKKRKRDEDDEGEAKADSDDDE